MGIGTTDGGSNKAQNSPLSETGESGRLKTNPHNRRSIFRYFDRISTHFLRTFRSSQQDS